MSIILTQRSVQAIFLLVGSLIIAGVEDWAKPAWTRNGKMHAVPVEAHTVELYYNKDAVKKVGVEVPASFQLSQSGFLDLVKKGAAAGKQALRLATTGDAAIGQKRAALRVR